MSASPDHTRKKVCVITGTRAEYGLLAPLITLVAAEPALELQLIVTGAHLCPEFGLTVREIEAAGHPISERVQMLLCSDTEEAVSTSMGIGMIGFAKAYARLNPDMLVVLGDRYEIHAAVSAAVPFRIAVAHLHGGELTEGAIDDCMRHAITKMSHLHFTAAEAYRRRVISMGERPERVFNVGALGVDNARGLKLLTREELSASLGFDLSGRYVMVTFHPVTLEGDTAGSQMKQLLDALESLEGVKAVFTYANADTHGRVVNRMIAEYVGARPEKSAAFASLGHERYLSAVAHSWAVAGNSSSGIIEAPALGVPTINIGDRQKGRERANSVIDCAPSRDAIAGAFRLRGSAGFEVSLADIKNPYGGGGTAGRILDIIKTVDTKSLLRKGFYEPASEGR